MYPLRVFFYIQRILMFSHRMINMEIYSIRGGSEERERRKFAFTR